MLHNNVDMVVRFESFMELYDMLVGQLLQEHDFSANTLSPMLVSEFTLVIDFCGIIPPFRLFEG